MKLLVALVGVVVLASCSGGGIASKFYVVVKPDEAAKFMEAVRAISKEAGLETTEAQAVADTGSVLRVVEGRGRGRRLWVESTLLSGNEDPKLCGVHFEPYSDPAQFTVFTEPRFFGTRTAAKELGERVFSQLQRSGFDVRRESPVCGAAAIHYQS
jgi:hypothetical protein